MIQTYVHKNSLLFEFNCYVNMFDNRQLGICVEQLTFIFEKIITIVIINTYDNFT